MADGRRPPDLSTRQLRAVVAVARYENFLAAAVALGASQPAVSRAVKQAEAQLGVALFERTTRRVRLTPAGRAFAPTAERLLADLDAGVRDLAASADARPRLYVASLISLTYDAIPAACAAFWAERPDVEIVLRQRLQAHILNDLRAGLVDVGVCNREVAGDDVEAIPIGRESFLVMTPPDHRLAGRPDAAVADLAGERLISIAHASNLRGLIDRAAEEAGVALDHAITLDHITLLDRFVRRGLGVAVVPASMRRAGAGDVAYARLADPPLATEIVAYVARARGLTPLAERFVEHVRRAFKDCGAE